MPDLAILGPGAIGGTVAARLAITQKHRMIVCARSPLTRLMIETNGDPITIAPQVHTAPGQVRPVDWVLIATKAYDAPAAANWLTHLLGPETRVAVLQNGVEHVERFAPYVPKTRIVPVIVDMPVERLGPGHFRQRAGGKLTVAAGPSGQDFAALFADTGLEIRLAPDFRSDAWRKLALNCAGAVSAVTMKPGGIVHNADAAEIMRALVRECIAVARAEGANLEDSLVETILDRYRNGPPDTINSLHADRIAGRPMEIDARNGAIVRIGRRHGIDTPVNRTVSALLAASA